MGDNYLKIKAALAFREKEKARRARFGWRERNRHFASVDEPEDLHKSTPNAKIRGVADSYAQSKGLTLNHDMPATKVNPEFAKKVADAYQNMPHTPNHPDTKRAYDALIDETTQQLHHLQRNGYTFSKIPTGAENPYKGGSKELVRDLAENNHAWYYPSDEGFGSSEHDNTHPLLRTVKDLHGNEMPANDAFRVVHDVFGHGKEGHSFGPNGEDNAWRHHMQMYSPEARKALTSETRGQNSVVNFGPHGEHNRANPSKTIYADQKAGLLPEWTMGEAPSSEVKKSAPLQKGVSNWAVKIKGKPGYHPVKDVVDMGAGKQNSYLLHDGTTVPHAHVEDLDMNHKPKPAASKLEKGLNGDWQKEGYNLKYTSGAVGSKKTHTVTAYDKHGNDVGSADFLVHTSGQLYPSYVGVDDDHQRKGLATAMYQHAEERTGKRVLNNPSLQLDDGAKLWAQPNRPFGKSESLTKGLSLDAVKRKYKEKKEPSLKEKVASVKAKNAEPQEKPFADQVKDVKEKYSTSLKGISLAKSLKDRLQKSEVPSVSIVGVMENGKLLMGRRNDDGAYTFPGGHLEGGESPEYGAKRELYEEAGLQPEHLHYLGKKLVSGHDGQRRLIHVFICRAPHSKANSRFDPDQEVTQWESVSVTKGRLPEDVESNLHVPANKNVMLQFLREAN